MKPAVAQRMAAGEMEVRLEVAYEAKLDEHWSYVGNKLIHVGCGKYVDHATNKGACVCVWQVQARGLQRTEGTV